MFHKILLLLICCYHSSNLSIGRIGETSGILENRLLKNNGIVLSHNEINYERQTGMPYLAFEEFFPKPYQVKLYFKSSDGSRPKLSELESSKLSQAFDRNPPPKKPLKTLSKSKKRLEGWELHVLYIKGLSALEVYKKSNALTESEIKYLLGLQKGQSFWSEISEDELPEGKFSALGIDLIRDDGILRAKKLGKRALMIFRSQTDEFFYHFQFKEQKEMAPESIRGF